MIAAILISFLIGTMLSGRIVYCWGRSDAIDEWKQWLVNEGYAEYYLDEKAERQFRMTATKKETAK